MSERTLNLFKIKVLAEVCKTNSYRITTNNLHITPSAVSKIIKRPEKEWNLPLVASKGNSIIVNAQAEQLARLADKLLTAVSEFIGSSNELGDLESGTAARIWAWLPRLYLVAT